MRIDFSPQAEKFFDKLRKSAPQSAKTVAVRIKKLIDNPAPPDSEQMKGEATGRRKIAAGDYRIIYSPLDDNALLIEFIEHRRDVYRKYKRRNR